MCKIHGTQYLKPTGKGKNRRIRCQKCDNISRKKRRLIKKLKLITHFGGACIVCGYNKCPAVLSFHHRDPEHKEFSISSRTTESYEKLLKEAEKCDLLCTNCHGELHFEEANLD